MIAEIQVRNRRPFPQVKRIQGCLLVATGTVGVDDAQYRGLFLRGFGVENLALGYGRKRVLAGQAGERFPNRTVGNVSDATVVRLLLQALKIAFPILAYRIRVLKIAFIEVFDESGIASEKQ